MTHWTVTCADVMDWAERYEGPPFHALLADPPYGLEFMGKEWDAPWKTGMAEFGLSDGGNRNPGPVHGSKRNPICLKCHKRARGKQVCECDEPDWDETPQSNNQKLQAVFTKWFAAIGEHLLPGAFCMAFAGSRTWHRIAVAIEDAGYIIHPTIFCYVNGQGFPKATKISKNGRHGAFEGHRYGLQAMKPAVEPILLFQKPYAGRSVDSITSTGAGALNIDGGRIEGTWTWGTQTDITGGGFGTKRPSDGFVHAKNVKSHPSGRWPPNFALSHVPPQVCASCAGAGCPGCGGEGVVGGCRRVLKINNLDNVGENYFRITIVEDSVNLDAQFSQKFINCDVPGFTPLSVMLLRRVQFNDYARIRKKEIDNKSAPRTLYDFLMNEVHAAGLKHFPDGNFGVRNSNDTLLNCARSVKGHMGQDNATPENPGASDGTADRAFCLTETIGPYFEILAANGTGKFDPVALVTGPEFVRTLARASSALSLSEFGIGDTVNGAANRTNSIASWHFIISRNDYTRLLQSCQLIDNWACVEGCPVRALGEQSGERPVSIRKGYDNGGEGMFFGGQSHPGNTYGDQGTAARFFFNADWSYEVAEQLAAAEAVYYCAKASRRERDAGLEEWAERRVSYMNTHNGNPEKGQEWEPVDERIGKSRNRFAATVRNPHPTVKPVSLTKWLATLLLPPAEYAPRRILVPFSGSGSEALGALLTGWDEIVAVDSVAEYCAIAEARLSWWAEQAAGLMWPEPKEILKRAKTTT